MFPFPYHPYLSLFLPLILCSGSLSFLWAFPGSPAYPEQGLSLIALTQRIILVVQFVNHCLWPPTKNHRLTELQMQACSFNPHCDKKGLRRGRRSPQRKQSLFSLLARTPQDAEARFLLDRCALGQLIAKHGPLKRQLNCSLPAYSGCLGSVFSSNSGEQKTEADKGLVSLRTEPCSF